MKILITAANGQLGTDASAFFAKRGDEVVAYKDVELDITDREKVMKAVAAAKPDVVLNCAAITNVDGCEKNEALADRVNADGAEIVALAAQAAGARLVHISTDYVFDGSGTAPYRETDPTCPNNAYGRSKLKGEERVLGACPASYILRTAWLYGPHGNNFVKTMLRLAKDNGSVQVVTDQVGNPTSTFELIRIIDAVLRAGKPGVYHATCSGVCSWNEFAREIFRLAGVKTEVVDVTSEQFVRPAKRPAYSNLSKEKLERECGYRPADWQDALKEYFAYRED
jgi:dTDP-4-dehydrorhamnose reductase